MKRLTKILLFERGLTLLTMGLLMSMPVMAQSSVAYDWNNVAIGGGGFVSSVIAAPNDPNIFYARTDVGGAYRWDESTQSWTPLLDWVPDENKGYLGIDGIAVDPNVPGRVYMLVGIGYLNDGESAFLRSDDYGETWEQFDITSQFKGHGNGMGRNNGERIAVDPNNSQVIFLGTRYDGLWKSTDRGSSWTQVSSFNTPAPNYDRGIHEAGVNVITFDPSSEANGVSQTIYASVSHESDNLFVSHDAGASWSLVSGRPTTVGILPQRMKLTDDGRYLYITYGNGGGPHPMLWSGVEDYFNRGAVYKYDTQEETWTDISPENYMQDLDLIAEGENQVHYGAYSGIDIDPNNPERIMVTSINSWRGAQMWNIDGTWSDHWGDNIFVSEDGGETWRNMFRYYWLDGGQTPPYEMIDEGDFPWIQGNTCHWNGNAVFDPNDPDRAFVTSGNGVFSTNNLTATATVDGEVQGRATWTFTADGIEETVPLGLESLPGGPLVSAIGDYDGFVHSDLTQPSPNGQYKTVVNGQETTLGTTTGLAYAAQNTDVLAKAANNTATVNNSDVSICGVTISSDGGHTWDQIFAEPTPVSVTPAEGSLFKGEVAVSADGAVVVWSPMSMQNIDGEVSEAFHPELFYFQNSAWNKSQGVEFSCNPVADPVNADVFYAYNPEDGYMYISNDKGATFTQGGNAGTSGRKRARTAPGIEGDIWVPRAPDGGLVRSTDGGQTFSTISGISSCQSVGFGASASGSGYPTVYIYGTINSVTGVFRSTDEGASWVRVNDDEHEYGGPGDAQIVIGDKNVFGRVYMSTAGRGIVYGEPAGPNVPVNGVSVSPTSAEINIGETLQLTAEVSPSDATNKSVSWSSDNTAVATVSPFGVVTGQSEGNATITVTTDDGGYTASVSISVTNIQTPVTGVSVSPSAVAVNPGETTTLTATIIPSDASNQNVSWSSDNTSIATVDASGIVSGIAEGVTTITVTTEDGGFTASSSVTVTTGSTGGSGTILREYWTGISGTEISSLTSNTDYPDNPTGSEEITSLEGPVDWDDNYGTRIRGYVHAPATGEYTFWVAGDDYTDLYVSSDDSPANASRIAYVEGWTNSREWDKYASQSATVNLTAGARYYIEVLHKEGSGGDNVAVAWEGPSISQAVIDGDYLSPFETEPGGNNDPNAAIVASTTSGTVPLTVDFDASGSSDPDGDNLTYNWTFGDGGTATGIAPSHTYNATGTFTSTVTVDDGNGGTDNASVDINVTEEPLPQYTLSTSTNGSGSISLDPAGGTYDEGTVVTVTASPSSGWQFDNWSGDLSGSTNPTTITMNADQSVTANFSETTVPQFTLSTSTNGQGSISLDPAGGTYDEGTVVTVTASAASGWSFDNWSGALSGSTNPASITMNSDLSVTANFSEDPTGEPCESPTSISMPFSFDGEGDYCWVTTDEIANVNSWNLDELLINGVDFTNQWSNNLPPAENGEWVIEYSGPYTWSHFEAAALSNASLKENGANHISLYPMPFTEALTLEIDNHKQVRSITILDNAGRIVQLIKQTEIEASMEVGSDLEQGMYIIKVDYTNDVQTFNVMKQ